MKKLLLLLVMFALSAFASATCPGTTTPALGLCKPSHGTPNWDQYYNSNWDLLDTATGAGAVVLAPSIDQNIIGTNKLLFSSFPSSGKFGFSGGYFQDLGNNTLILWNGSAFSNLEVGALLLEGSTSFDTLSVQQGSNTTNGVNLFRFTDSSPAGFLIGLFPQSSAISEITTCPGTCLAMWDINGKLWVPSVNVSSLSINLPVCTDGSKNLATSGCPTTLAGYGITDAVINTRTVNGKALSSNITLGLASADFANQGTTTTVLHGNGAGNPSFAAVSLANDITGQLAIGNVGSAGLSGTSPIVIASTGAISCATCTTNTSALTSNSVVLGAGSQASKVVAGIITDGVSILTLGVAGTSVGEIDFKNGTSGTIAFKPVTGALGTPTISIPAVTATMQTTSASDTTTTHVLHATATGFIGTFSAIVAGDLPTTPLTTGTSVTLVAPRQYFICTGTCTVTVPVPAAGYEFCIMNDDNVSTAITLSALGSSAMYENTARTAYGTAGTGTLVATAVVGNKVCLVGRDATHYLTVSFNGTWTAN